MPLTGRDAEMQKNGLMKLPASPHFHFTRKPKPAATRRLNPQPRTTAVYFLLLIAQYPVNNIKQLKPLIRYTCIRQAGKEIFEFMLTEFENCQSTMKIIKNLYFLKTKFLLILPNVDENSSANGEFFINFYFYEISIEIL